MHEMSIAMSILTIVSEEKERHGLSRVDRVIVHNGAMAGVVTDALYFAWDAVTRGSELEGSKIVIEEIPLRVACGSCTTEFSPEDRLYMPCPACGMEIGHTVLAGRELLVAGIEGDDASEGEGQGSDQGE